MDFTGTRLLIDLVGCTGLDDIYIVERALRDAVPAAGATLLELRLHSFGLGQGATGVAMLAELHISITFGQSAIMLQWISFNVATAIIRTLRPLLCPRGLKPNQRIGKQLSGATD